QGVTPMRQSHDASDLKLPLVKMTGESWVRVANHMQFLGTDSIMSPELHNCVVRFEYSCRLI
ncbi:MAG: hypothetical protein ACREOZ_03445, partial [Gloeomargaritales cyanobacterium]